LGNIIDYKKVFACMSITGDHPEKGTVSFLCFDDKVCLNSDDELSGVGRFMGWVKAAANQNQTAAAAART
jgi:hypothetical protein